MKKVFVSVEVPAILKTYDFKVPVNMKVKDVIIMMSSVIADEFAGINKNTDKARLVLKETRTVMVGDSSFLDYNMRDEDKLILL